MTAPSLKILIYFQHVDYYMLFELSYSDLRKDSWKKKGPAILNEIIEREQTNTSPCNTRIIFNLNKAGILIALEQKIAQQSCFQNRLTFRYLYVAIRIIR